MAPAPAATPATRAQSSRSQPSPIKEERSASAASSSSLSSEDADSDNAVRAVRPLTIDTSAFGRTDVATARDGAMRKTADADTATQQAPSSDSTATDANRAVPRQTSLKAPKLLAVARDIMRNTLSPRTRAASAVTTPSSASTVSADAAKATPTTAGFGKIRRSNTGVKTELRSKPTTEVSSPSTSSARVFAPQQSVRRQTVEQQPALEPTRQRRSVSHRTTGDNADAAAATAVAPSHALTLVDASSDSAAQDDASSSDHADHALVDAVCRTLDELIVQLDSIDPKKLYAIRLGSELRGLLGKAQDECLAYEHAFIEHARHVGVAIALQNFAASLEQVFAIVARLAKATTTFLLNSKFKREVLFAFQEINSYYTSLFMELAMAVAERAGIVLPLPSPVKPSLPVVVDEPLPPRPVVAVEEERAPEPLPPPPVVPTADVLCLEAHQYYYGHRRPKDFAKALDLYKLAAELESVEARACLGDMYAEGIGVETDPLVAETWLTEAASGGSIDACHSLGRLLCERAKHQTQHEHTQRELYALAMVRFTHAAENGHSSAQYELGVMYERGVASARDDHEAIEWYKRAAAQGHTGAEVSLGRLLYDAERDRTQAIHYFQRAAAKNDASAQRCLGRVFTNGDGVKRDLERAIAYYRKAVENGDCRAMFELAQVLLTPATAVHESSPAIVRFGDREDAHDEALRLLLNAGAGGVVDAFFALGELLEHSAFLRDRAAALRFYTKAATATPSHSKAAKRAAAMHYSGIGTTADKRKAHALYAVAASAGDADALNALGLMYEEGEGCDLDFASAAACYRKAVELRNPHAHFNLGCLLAHGKGVARNQESAQAHFHKTDGLVNVLRLQALELGYALARDFIKPTD